MNSETKTLVLLIALMGTTCVSAFAASRPENPRASEASATRGVRMAPWTLRTSVQARYFCEVGDRVQGASAFFSAPVQAVLPSPDGGRFLVLLTSADLSADQVVRELRIYDAAAVLKAVSAARRMPEPIRVYTRRSASNAPAILHPVWSKDGSFVQLMVVSDPERQATPRLNSSDLPDTSLVKLVSLNVATGETTDLIPPGYIRDTRSGIDMLAWQGDAVLYRTFPLGEPAIVQAPASYPVTRVDNVNLLGMGGSKIEAVRGPRSILLGKNGQVREIPGIGAGDTAAAISPKGDVAIVAASYGASEVPSGFEYGKDVMARRSRFLLLDMESGSLRPLFDAPAGNALAAVTKRVPLGIRWATDGSKAILINTSLPLDSVRRQRANEAYVASFDLSTRAVEEVCPITSEGFTVSGVQWANQDKLLRVEMIGDNGNRKTVGYRRHAGNWVAERDPRLDPGSQITWTMPDFDAHEFDDRTAPGPMRASNGLALELREGPNAPQVLVATHGNRERRLIDIDSELSGVAIAQSRVVKWVTDDQREESGLLTLPLETDRKRPPPLVIQNYFFMPHLFRPDGPAPSAYAAQLLAANGIAVLGIDLSMYQASKDAQLTEGRRGVMTVDAAVERLAREGLVDPTRVAMVGFSRGGFVPFYTLTHPGRIRLTTAISSDSVLFTYGSYIRSAARLYPNYPQLRSQSESSLEFVITNQRKGNDFWHSKDVWLRENSEFNVDQASGPYMFVGAGTDLSYYDAFADLMGMFTITRRPLEILNMPLASHPVVRPREREASLSETVDWMSFWLAGRVDLDERKKEKYVRWKKMKEEWERQPRPDNGR